MRNRLTGTSQDVCRQATDDLLFKHPENIYSRHTEVDSPVKPQTPKDSMATVSLDSTSAKCLQFATTAAAAATAANILSFV